ncbi:MAG: S-layer homology domain-containing protein [Bacillota bacterium]|nr:S-layer homology domain-containing protein [Bacillota bacterium]
MKRALLTLTMSLSILILCCFGVAAKGLDGDPSQTQQPTAQECQEVLEAISGLDWKITGSAPAAAAAEVNLSFADTQNHWAKTYIEYVTNLGLFQGTSANTFAPNINMTRAMFVTVLGRFSGIDQTLYPESYFGDVAVGQWYSAYVQWAAANGIVYGHDNGNFGPNDNITREQMAALIYRYCAFAGIDPIMISNDYKFNDEAAISSYAIGSVNFVKLTGLLTGKGNNQFKPKDNATRAEVATVMTRLIKISKGERIYVNYNTAANNVPTYSSVVLQDCIGTMYNDNTVVQEYDMNGTAFIYPYNPEKVNTYCTYLVNQGFTLIESTTEDDITIYLYSKGSNIMSVAIKDNLVFIFPDVNKLQM